MPVWDGNCQKYHWSGASVESSDVLTALDLIKHSQQLESGPGFCHRDCNLHMQWRKQKKLKHIHKTEQYIKLHRTFFPILFTSLYISCKYKEEMAKKGNIKEKVTSRFFYSLVISCWFFLIISLNCQGERWWGKTH